MGVSLQVCGLSVKYGSFPALQELDFFINKGDFVALIGPNGAGKSSLLNCISRVLRPSQGIVFLNEKDLQRIKLQEMARSMAVVPQSTSVDFDFTVEEVVTMGRYPYLGRFQKEKENDRQIVCNAMEVTGVKHLAKQSAQNLSGGERQRVIIARALAQEPELLLLDEPTANLDINYQVEFLNLVRRLNREKGITVIAAIHDLNLAAQFFDHFVLLAEKKILDVGKPETVLTTENISFAYGIPVAVQRNSLHGRPHITVLKHFDSGKKEKQTSSLRVHVIGGGEEAVPLITSLLEANFSVSVGPLTREDSGHQLASYYGLPVVTLPPFSPVTDEHHRQHLVLLKEARAVVIPAIPFGVGNLRNLEAVEEVLSSSSRLLIMEDTLIEERDYSGGEAAGLCRCFKEKGALSFSDREELLTYLMDLERDW